jgi:hypothetical protein
MLEQFPVRFSFCTIVCFVFVWTRYMINVTSILNSTIILSCKLKFVASATDVRSWLPNHQFWIFVKPVCSESRLSAYRFSTRFKIVAGIASLFYCCFSRCISEVFKPLTPQEVSITASVGPLRIKFLNIVAITTNYNPPNLTRQPGRSRASPFLQIILKRLFQFWPNHFFKYLCPSIWKPSQ